MTYHTFILLQLLLYSVPLSFLAMAITIRPALGTDPPPSYLLTLPPSPTIQVFALPWTTKADGIAFFLNREKLQHTLVATETSGEIVGHLSWRDAGKESNVKDVSRFQFLLFSPRLPLLKWHK
jgi:hypothetical protein